MTARVVTGLVLVAVLAAGCATTPGVQAPYVQTPTAVVTAMLRLATVGPTDVVYDLGSGDGRVVIAAARDFGARGVGVELEPRLVEESRRIAARAGVAERAQFVQQDIFVTDVSPATVVTLYLGADLNARLHPRLLAQLKPGSRIVSHDFPIVGWEPARTITVQGPDRTHTLHLWTVP
jgi:SAM-dependent methyltransferase